MKKALSIIMACSIAISSFAQEHLSFKGIPITGSVTEFCKSLSQKGFTKLDTEKNITIFKGDFPGRKSTVLVGATDDGKSVYTVVVLFDASGEWNVLTNTYDYYKDIYTRKYGNTSFCQEKNPAHSDSNVALMAEVHQGTVVWASQWEPTGGTIELSIEKADGVYEGMVVIRYRDDQNVEAKIQRDMEDI